MEDSGVVLGSDPEASGPRPIQGVFGLSAARTQARPGSTRGAHRDVNTEADELFSVNLGYLQVDLRWKVEPQGSRLRGPEDSKPEGTKQKGGLHPGKQT